jgi:hypothetical protein
MEKHNYLNPAHYSWINSKLTLSITEAYANVVAQFYPISSMQIMPIFAFAMASVLQAELVD